MHGHLWLTYTCSVHGGGGMYIRGNTALKQWEFPVVKEIQQMLRMIIGYFSQVKSCQVTTPRVPK